jgi:hypothetical protein
MHRRHHRPAAATAALAAALLAGAAHAGHTVVFGTEASAFVQASVSESWAQLFNVNGVAHPAYHVVQGPAASHGSNTLQPGATVVDAWASAVGAVHPAVIGLSSAATAHASLDQGLLRSTVQQAGQNVFGAPAGLAYSRLRDTLFFTNAGTEAVTLQFSFRFDGALMDPNGGNPGGAAKLYLSGCGLCSNEANEDIRFATGPQNVAQLQLAASFDQRGIYSFTNLGSPLPIGASDSVTVARGLLDGVGGQVDGSIRVSLLIPTGQTALGIGAYLDLDCRSGSSCLFGNTARFGFDALPAGLTMGSASGVFMTTPVPEPQTWALMAGGLGLLLLLRRRRQQPATAA